MPSRVVVVGSANTDLVCLVDRLPEPGETVLGGQFLQAAGGKGANQAVAAARLGAEVTFIARLGTDAYGDRAVAGYAADGLETRFLVRDPDRPSGVALILVDSGGENQIAVAPGANGALTPADIEAARSAFEQAQVVLLQLEIPLDAVAAAARLGHECGAKVILNPAPAPPEPLPAELLGWVDVLTPNETEAARLASAAGEPPTALLHRLSQFGVESVVLTRGRAGALVSLPEGVLNIPAPVVTAVDATAAGDAFNGALAVGLAGGRPWSTAVRQACAAGALAATKAGAQPSLPTLTELQQLLAAWRTGGEVQP